MYMPREVAQLPSPRGARRQPGRDVQRELDEDARCTR